MNVLPTPSLKFLFRRSRKAPYCSFCIYTIRLPHPVLYPNMFNYPLDVVFAILRACTLPTLCRFSAASRDADKLVADELARRRKNILSRFVIDREGLCRMLSSTSSVITGSAALAICAQPEHLIPGDLDICAAFGYGETLALHFVTREGYSIDDHILSAALPTLSRAGVHQVIRLSQGPKFIDIIESVAVLSTFPIPQFWSTAPMVFISATTMHALYPLLLETNRAIVNNARRIELLIDSEESEQDYEESEDSDGRSTASIDPLQTMSDKLNTWGITVEDDIDRLPSARTAPCGGRDAPDCPLTVRYIGDQHTLQRSVGPVSERIANITTQLGQTHTIMWWLGGQPCDGNCSATGEYVTPCVRVESVEHLH